MQDASKWILGFVGFATLVAFTAGVGLAGYYTLWMSGAPQPNLMPNVATYFMSSVNGLLASHLGAYLGVSVAVAAWKPPAPLGWLQVTAAVWYVVVLVGAWVIWFMAGLTEDSARVVAILPEICRVGIGIFIALFGAALGVHNATIRHTFSGMGGNRAPPNPTSG